VTSKRAVKEKGRKGWINLAGGGDHQGQGKGGAAFHPENGRGKEEMTFYEAAITKP